MDLKLLKPLVRSGIIIPVGAVIDVPEPKVEWFISNGFAEKIQILVSSSESEPTSRKTRRKKT